MEEAGQIQKDNIGKKKGAGKYIFECQKCGRCCEEKDFVAVTLSDFERWNMDLTLPSLYPYLGLELVDESFVRLSLRKNRFEEGEKNKGCPLYDGQNKICNIYFSMPLFCGSYPLGYDGHNFYIKDRSCPGIDKGTMTPDLLKKARDEAKQDLLAQVNTSMLLPVIQGLVMGFILEQSKKRFDKLSPEQRKQLDEILKEQKAENLSR